MSNEKFGAAIDERGMFETPNGWTTIHALLKNDAAAVSALRARAEPHKGEMRGVEARGAFDEIMERTPEASGITYETDAVAGISGLWCRPAAAPLDEAVLYFHGGWYHWGSAKAYRHFVGQIAARAERAVFVPDYRLAPEHPFPSAIDDAHACLAGLRARGFARIALAGDSAGGGLALLAGAGVTGIIVFSPLTDLSLGGASWTTRAQNDPYFTRAQAESLVPTYLDDLSTSDPSASPLFGDLAGLPPIRIHTGDDEVLLDDSTRYAERAFVAGVDVKLDVWRGMPHVFPTGIASFEAARDALDRSAMFIRDRLGAVG